MKALRQMSSGFIIGAISLLLVIGGISLSLTETSGSSLPPTPSPIPTTFAVDFAAPFPTQDIPTAAPTETIAFAASATQAVQAVCAIPSGWILITVGVGEDLNTIAQRYNTTTDELNQKNCLNFINPAPGTKIYVPAVATQVVVQCFPPNSWVKKHVVRAGENLFRIAMSYGITYPQLQAGNCMGGSTTIFVGQLLWVPNVSTITPLPPTITFTIAVTNTPVSTSTNTPDFSTPTFTFTPSPTFVVTSSPVPATSTPSLTPLPSATAP